MFVCVRVKGQRSKKHFLCLSAFALDLEETWSRSRPKFKKTSISSGCKGQKNIFFLFLLQTLDTWYFSYFLLENLSTSVPFCSTSKCTCTEKMYLCTNLLKYVYYKYILYLNHVKCRCSQTDLVINIIYKVFQK